MPSGRSCPPLPFCERTSDNFATDPAWLRPRLLSGTADGFDEAALKSIVVTTTSEVRRSVCYRRSPGVHGSRSGFRGGSDPSDHQLAIRSATSLTPRPPRKNVDGPSVARLDERERPAATSSSAGSPCCCDLPRVTSDLPRQRADRRSDNSRRVLARTVDIEDPTPAMSTPTAGLRPRSLGSVCLQTASRLGPRRRDPFDERGVGTDVVLETRTRPHDSPSAVPHERLGQGTALLLTIRILVSQDKPGVVSTRNERALRAAQRERDARTAARIE